MSNKNEPVRNSGTLVAVALAVVALINAAVPLLGIDVDTNNLAAFNTALVGLAAAMEGFVTKWQRSQVWGPVTHEKDLDDREMAVQEGPPEDGTEPTDPSSLDLISEPYPEDVT